MLPALDWAQPWFSPWREPGEAVAARVAAGQSVHEALNAAAPPVRFVPQHELPAATPYEQFIFASGLCPVRPGLHDFFNGLCWLRFPRTKRALNRLQAQEILQQGIGPRRGPVRDAITVFDENGALLLDAPQPLWEALRAREWRRLFVDLRPLWGRARLLVFGHALLEKLVAPRKDLTAHVWVPATRAIDPGADIDAWLSHQCTSGMLNGKPFTPLPVLGLPGWDPRNENFSFYDDSLVFRSRRTRQQRHSGTEPPPRAGP